MRLLLALIVSLPLLGQQAQPLPSPAPASQQKATTAGKPEAQAEQKEAQQPPAPAPQAPAEQAATPVPAGEPNLTGSIDFGFRWRELGGSAETYRSIVNLNQGPKLFGADFTLLDPKKRAFDRLDVRGYNWGDEPYSTFHLDARKLGFYDLSFDYRNLAYFNDLPSFADPLLAERGFMLDERAFDLRRRMTDFQIDLRPGKRFIPYFAFDRDSDIGHGIATFVDDSANEFAVPQSIDTGQNNYRGGVRIELNRFHATLEQGGTTYGNHDQLLGTGMQNFGDRTTPYFGRTLLLNNALQAYAVDGHSIYSRVLVTANPVGWADLYGQFLFSQPRNDIHYNQNESGQLVMVSSLLFFNSQTDALTGTAELPHLTGNVGAEIRPFKRLRIIESLMTDRMHNASAGVLAEQFFAGGALALSQGLPLADRLALNYNREEVNALFDVLPRLTLRGGYRREWGDADVRAPQLLSQFAPLESGKLQRNVGLAGVSYRPSQKLSGSFDFEGASTAHDYFNASLYDYQRISARARYQALTSLSVNANFTYLNNNNPLGGAAFDFQARQNTLSLAWTPAAGKYVTLTGDYTRSTVDSAINIRIPEDLSTQRYVYRDNAHIASALLDVNLPKYAGLTPKLSLGGSFFISHGSRPTSFYQPYVRALIPLQKHVYWTSEWRYYGFGENLFLYEGFRAHLIQTGLRLTR